MAKKCGETGKMQDGEKKREKPERKGYTIRYETAHGGGIVVELPFNPRKGKCDACGKTIASGEIKITALHHWWYSYQPKTVKENPILALENTSELCFGCHQCADAIRALIYASPQRVAMIAELLRGEPREKFIKVLEEITKRLKEQDLELAKKILEMSKDAKKS
jgi:hypothetical protein